MSVDTQIRPENGLALSSAQTKTTHPSGNTLPEDATAQKDPASTTDDASNSQDGNKPPNQTSTSQSSLLGSLWSPISSLQKSIFGYSSAQDAATASTASEKNEVRENGDSAEHQSASTSEISPEVPSLKQPSPSSTSPNPTKLPPPNTTSLPNQNPKPDQNQSPNTNPTLILPPTKTPTYIRLQKTRLSGTRTKQLLRAGSRAHDDPPPPPELGACCGSSCDPCVNDLWREERDVWREVWGVNSVEGKREGLEW